MTSYEVKNNSSLHYKQILFPLLQPWYVSMYGYHDSIHYFSENIFEDILFNVFMRFLWKAQQGTEMNY